MLVTVFALFVGSEIMEMVGRSGPVGKTILVILLLFSVFSWTVIYAKWRSFGRARRESERFLRTFRKSQKLSEVSAVLDHFPHAPLAAVFAAGLQEVEQQASPASVQRALQIAANEQVSEMETLLSPLATTATTTPFIGLFGTVWGIIDAFHGLGTSGGAQSIRVIAPGISEALIATAAGLFAAIPAVIFYNHFLHQLRQFGGSMDNFALEFMNAAERYHS